MYWLGAGRETDEYMLDATVQSVDNGHEAHVEPRILAWRRMMAIGSADFVALLAGPG